jgi:hypothetical protein
MQVSAFLSKIEIQAVKGCVLISEAFIVIKSNQVKERINKKAFFRYFGRARGSKHFLCRLSINGRSQGAKNPEILTQW